MVQCNTKSNIRQYLILKLINEELNNIIMKIKKLLKEDINEICNEYKKGGSVSKLAKKYETNLR